MMENIIVALELLVQLSETVYSNIRDVANMIAAAQAKGEDITEEELNALSSKVQNNLDNLKKLLNN